MARSPLKSGPLWQISILTQQEAEEAVSYLMADVFGIAPSVYTPAESKIVSATVYTDKALSDRRRQELRHGLHRIESCGLSIKPGTIRTRKVPKKDWRESWKKNFRTIEIGSSLLIKPSWSQRHARKGQAVVILDPGLSFGTGQHPTTAFCLEELVQARLTMRQQSFLDLGAGSGILSIAAAKLGYSPVRGFDSDPVAVRIAQANLRRNRVENRVRIIRRDLMKLPDGNRSQYDVVGANLTDDLLIAASGKIVRLVKPTGHLILAGILAAQFAAVRREYERRGMHLISRKREGEWHSGTFVWGAHMTAGSEPG